MIDPFIDQRYDDIHAARRIDLAAALRTHLRSVEASLTCPCCGSEQWIADYGKRHQCIDRTCVRCRYQMTFMLPLLWTAMRERDAERFNQLVQARQRITAPAATDRPNGSDHHEGAHSCPQA